MTGEADQATGGMFHPKLRNADLFAMLSQATEVCHRFGHET